MTPATYASLLATEEVLRSARAVIKLGNLAARSEIVEVAVATARSRALSSKDAVPVIAPVMKLSRIRPRSVESVKLSLAICALVASVTVFACSAVNPAVVRFAVKSAAAVALAPSVLIVKEEVESAASALPAESLIAVVSFSEYVAPFVKSLAGSNVNFVLLFSALIEEPFSATQLAKLSLDN